MRVSVIGVNFLSYRRFITACIALVVFPGDAYFVTGFSAFDGEL
jgi:hypothetical protein